MDGTQTGWIESALNWIFGICTTALAGWNSYLMNAISKNRDDILSVKDLITKHELEDARNYVSRQDFKDTIVELKDTVKRMYEVIDSLSRDLRNK